MKHRLLFLAALAVASGSNAAEPIKTVPKSGPLTLIRIDHADAASGKDGGYICVFYVDIEGKRYHIEVNAPQKAGCPPEIWIGDRP